MELPKLNHIMLIDDDSTTNSYHEIIIKRYRIAEKVSKFVSGNEALNYLDNHPNKEIQERPDLIFLDLNMPIIDGKLFLESYAKLPAEKKARKLFVVSTSNYPANRQFSKVEHHVDGYFIKPMSSKKLIDLLVDNFSPSNQ